jgi:D-3-phosphoglycerate dehydrogenase
MKPRVLICDKLETVGVDLLKSAGLDVDYRTGLKGAELAAALQAADAAVVRSETQITEELLATPGKLRAVVRAGVGVDNIKVAAATRQGIVVMNTPDGNTMSAAEHTIALLLASARHVPAAHATLSSGKWDRKKFMGTQVAGKVLGIIGVGRIGREVARRAQGLDMKIVGYDPFLNPDRAAQLNITLASSVDDLLPQVDFLTIHSTLTDETRSMIGAEQLAKMKKGAHVLNVARGGIIDETALAAALKSGHLGGAGIDVFTFEPEPPPADHPLLTAPNVVLTPHLGASTFEAQERVAREAAELLVNFLTRGVIACAVNVAALDKAELDELRPYLDLARRLGLLQAQMAQGNIRKATLTCRGELAKRNPKLIAASFAAGLLEYRMAESVNVVNAEILARERGIEIVAVANQKPGDFGSFLHTEVETDKKNYTAGGTLFGSQYQRLAQLGPYRLDTYLDGVLLIFTHRDVPGLIGHIGTIFGKHQVNIAQMTVGRQQPGGEAIAVLNLDSLPPEEALNEVKAHERISSLCVVKLPTVGQLPAWLG